MTPYTPPLLLKKGLPMTLYTAFRAKEKWENTLKEPAPPYQPQIFTVGQKVPIFGVMARPETSVGTIIATYGITGTLKDQWMLKILGRKAFAQGYGVVLFDWRAHGKTAQLSSILTSDGIYEGEDFIHIAARAKHKGYAPPFWFMGYSLGGQLALWGIKEGEKLQSKYAHLGLEDSDLGGGAVICPNLDSNRSLSYLVEDIWGRHIEKAITKELKKLAWQLHDYHPTAIDPNAVERANSIRGFDQELVIKRLGFSTVEEYYTASSPLPFLPTLKKPTLILYAADDPMFDPSIVPDLERQCKDNAKINLTLTRYGGHVGYISSLACQRHQQDPDQWWAWNRVLEWCGQQSAIENQAILI